MCIRDRSIIVKNKEGQKFYSCLKDCGSLETSTLTTMTAFSVLWMKSIVDYIIRHVLFLRGFKIGYRESEWGVTVGSMLSVFGDIIYDAQKKELRIEKPKYFVGDVDSFINHKDLDTLLKAGAVGVCLGLVVFFMNTLSKRIKRRLRRR
eukprot:TRINITY_DN9461_c0_g1_i2.p1 TRINITY_DN9461_c0_g1~~TRINITY_DN9461_c0_g1_i2.p1  ORF type:complete len:149 (-),score=26.82 TRINITY_DN9461_c0_g1_i2:81-527(-)